MLDFLELGPLMDEAGGGDGGGGVAVADAASDFGGGEPAGGAEPSGGEVHDAEFVDPENAQQLEPVDKGQQPTAALVKAGESAVQNGKFTQSGRAAIEALKPLSPRLAQEVTQSLLVRDWLRRELPGGKRELATLKALAQQNGGEQGIAEMKFKADYLEKVDALFEAGDPQFIETITGYESGRNGFVKLMEPTLRKFGELDPARLSYHQARGAVTLLNGAGLSTLFPIMVAILNRAGKAYTAGKHEEASSFLAEIIDTYNSIFEAFNVLEKTAKTAPPALGSPTDPKVQDGKNELERERAALRKQQWESTVADYRKGVFSRAWEDQTKGRNLTPSQVQMIKGSAPDFTGLYRMRLNAMVKSWNNSAARFLANSDREGYLKEQYEFFKKAIPEAIRKSLLQALPGKPGPKTNQVGTPLRAPVNGKATTDRNGNAVRVAKMPPTSDLDPVRTTGDMLSANKAYTKDGRLVQWA